MYDTILVPLDGSEHAERAVEHGSILARAFEASLHLLTVVDVDAAAGPFSVGGVDESYIEQLTQDSRTAVEAVKSTIETTGTVETAVVTGRPSQQILDYIETEDIDIVCMGTHGRSGLGRYLIGSVAEDVLRRAPVPVLTMGATATSGGNAGYDDVLVPTDGSDQAEAVLDDALAIGEQFDSRIHAVSVANVSDITSTPDVAVPPDLHADLEAAAADAIATIERAATGAGLNTVTTVRLGLPKQELIDYVQTEDIDLVCMGTHGRTGVGRVLLGSVAEALIRQTDVPVLTVRTDAKA